MENALEMDLAEQAGLAEQIYLEAMLAGWASDGNAAAVSGMRGFKRAVYAKMGFQVVDTFGTVGEQETGTTSISFQGHSIWFMSYNGYYRPEDVPVLKKILMDTYRKGDFFGGRGPRSCPAGVGIYANEPIGSFAGFRGIEMISDRLGMRGYHNYYGAWIGNKCDF